MSRSSLAAIAIAVAIVIFYIWGQMPTAASVADSSSFSPNQKFSQLLALSPVRADELAELCDKYPQLGPTVLKNRSLPLAGTVDDFLVAGLSGRRVSIFIGHGSLRTLVAVYDLDHYLSTNFQPLEDQRIHFVAFGNELLKVTPPGFYRHGDGQVKIPEEIREVVLSRTQPFQQTLTFDRMNAHEIVFNGTPK